MSEVTRQEVTLVRDAIHNPAEPRHCMRLKPAGREMVARRDGIELARSRATRPVSRSTPMTA